MWSSVLTLSGHRACCFCYKPNRVALESNHNENVEFTFIRRYEFITTVAFVFRLESQTITYDKRFQRAQNKSCTFLPQKQNINAHTHVLLMSGTADD